MTQAAYCPTVQLGAGNAAIGSLAAGNNTIGALGAGNAVIGTVSVQSPGTVIQQTPVVTAGAYAAGKCVGGLLTLNNAASGTTRPSILQSVCVTDNSNGNVPLSILFFGSAPAGNYTDGNNVSLSSADLALVQAKVDVATGDYVRVGTGNTVLANGPNQSGLGKEIQATGNTSLYALAVATGAGSNNFTGNQSLTFTFGFLLG